MMSSTCYNCGRPKQSVAEFSQNFCNECTTAKNEAEQGFAAENEKGIQEGTVTQSDILYAGRRALMARAHTAHRNFSDPRLPAGR